MTKLPGETAQCLNPSCTDRGRWLRIETRRSDRCPSCGEPLTAVSPPLPALRPRRPLQTVYRPMARSWR